VSEHTCIPFCSIHCFSYTVIVNKKADTIDRLLYTIFFRSYGYYFVPGKGANYCDEYACLSVCLSAVISRNPCTGPNLAESFMHVACGHGSVLH